jgi:cell division septum initiation protein DivIVA
VLQKRIDSLIEQNSTTLQNSQVLKETIATLEKQAQELHQKIVETQKEKNELQKSTNFETFSKIRY